MGNLSEHFILILCGGSGPRLWPKSRSNFPKQFLKITGQESILQQTVKRFIGFIPKNNIFLITQKKYLDEIQKQLGNSIPRQQIILEPQKRNTAMAIGYASTIIRQKCPSSIISTLPSDHFIQPIKIFQQQLKTAYNIAKNSRYLVTFGINPTFPSTSYGYQVKSTPIKGGFLVGEFIEKPSPDKARILIQKKAYWNSGIYTFSINTLDTEFQLHCKDYYRLIQKLIDHSISVDKAYSKVTSISIDYAISEKSTNLAVLPARFTWSDIGEWNSIYNLLAKDRDQVVALDKNSEFIQIGSRRCLVATNKNKLIGLVNVDNLAIIDTPDALLICNLADNSSYNVRELVKVITETPKFKKYFLTKNDR